MWSDLVLEEAQVAISQLKVALAQQDCAPTEDLINSIVLALSDDLDTPLVLSLLKEWSASTILGSSGGSTRDLITALDALLGLKI
jgi:L-cysteine:1D-myo-inositol 2-amino-2-deoxy-alpha-D-glucopyranoside ligase